MSDSDYDVEEYIQPTVKRSTYDEEEEEKHISEQENSDDDNKSETSSEKSEVFDCSKKEVIAVPEKPKVIAKPPLKVEEFEPVRTSCRLILHVSNLTVEVTKSMLEAFFMGCGDIKSIRLPKRRAKNLAFVEMKDMDGYKVKLISKVIFINFIAILECINT